MVCLPWSKRAFTLVELLVVVSMVGILATIVMVNLSGQIGGGRNTERQADLRAMQAALEQYKRKYGAYPAQGCAGAWSTESCAAPYIADLAPEFLPKLPTDPRRDTGDGYAYRTNTERSAYKLMARGTVEGEAVTYAHEFAACQNNASMCNTTVGECQASNAIFRTSYAVWGGFASGADRTEVLDNTRDVICE